MGQVCCIMEVDSSKSQKSNKNISYNDIRKRQNIVENHYQKKSLNQSQDMDFPVHEKFSEIETKDANPSQNSRQNNHTNGNKYSFNQVHYNSVQNIIENQQDSQENTKGQPQTKSGGVPNRKDVQKQHNYKTFANEKNLDLSNSNTNYLQNNHCYTNPNENSSSNISDPSPQNFNIRQPSQYSIRMEDYLLSYIKKEDFHHHYQNINSRGGGKRNKSQSQLNENQKKALDKKIEIDLKNIHKQIICDEDNGGVFIACDASNIQYIKMLITGAANSPFAYGVYVFDIYIPDDYPNQPPRVNFQSTGSGKIRFSPLLPSDGRVCLNLLGILNGQEKNWSEQWSSSSNLVQLIQTIQTDIMNNELYFQEPSTIDYKGNTNNDSSFNVSDMYNLGYKNVVRYLNMVYAIEEVIKSSDSLYKEFNKAIQTHFFHLQSEIILEINKWISNQEKLQEDDIKPLYTGIVQQHNPSTVKIFEDQGFSKSAKAQLKNIILAFKRLNSQFKDSKTSVLNN